MKYRLYILPGLLLLFLIACQQRDTEISYPVAPPVQENNRNISNEFQAIDTQEIRSLITRGNIINAAQPDSALALFKMALTLSKKGQYSYGMAVSLLSLGSCYFIQKEDYKRANTFYFLAAPYCHLSSLKDNRLVPGLYNALANTYFMEGRYDSAMHFYYKALVVLQRRPALDTGLLVQTYINIGAVMGEMEQSGQSLQYLKKAHHWAMLKNDPTQLAMIYKNIGSAYAKASKDSTLKFYHEVLRLHQETGSKRNIQNIYNQIASVWLIENNLETARMYLDSAVLADPENALENYGLLHNLGAVYYAAGDFEKAIPYYEKSLKLSDEKGIGKVKLSIYGVLADIYNKSGKKHLAYHYQKAYSDLKDSIFSAMQLRTVNQLEVKYRTSEKDKQLAEKQLLIVHQQNKIQQQYLLGIAGVLVFILSLLGIVYRRKHKETIARLKASLAGEEKERLRMATELHDGIVSKLTAVKMNFDVLSCAYDGDVEEAAEFKEALFLLDQSIAELRTTAQNLQPYILKNSGLAIALAVYCQKISKVTNLDLQFQILGELPSLAEDFLLNIYRIIQEMIQNILKHARASAALVQLNVQEDQLCITIEDNGIGLPHEKLHSENGIGLANLQGRLKLMNGTFEIASHNGTSIYLIFDLKPFKVKSR